MCKIISLYDVSQLSHTMVRDIIVMSLTISLLYGISPVLHKYIYSRIDVDPYTLLFLSSTTFFVCTLIGFMFNKHKGKVVVTDIKNLLKNKKTFLIIILSALFSIYVANLLYFKVIQR